MSTTIAISPSEIRQIFQPRTASSSQFWELAQKANSLAVMVEERWEKFTQEQKELLTTFACAVIEPPKGIKAKILVLLSRFDLALALTWIVLKGEQDAFLAYYSAFSRLKNAIFGRIEREHSAYQKALYEAIEETFNNLENTQTMTAEEACERLRRISDRAIREL